MLHRNRRERPTRETGSATSARRERDRECHLATDRDLGLEPREYGPLLLEQRPHADPRRRGKADHVWLPRLPQEGRRVLDPVPRERDPEHGRRPIARAEGNPKRRRSASSIPVARKRHELEIPLEAGASGDPDRGGVITPRGDRQDHRPASLAPWQR